MDSCLLSLCIYATLSKHLFGGLLMSRFLAVMLSLSLFLPFAIAGQADSTVAVIDMKLIMHDAPQVQKAKEDFSHQYNPRRDALLAKSKQIHAAFTALAKDSKVLPKKEITAKNKALMAQQEALHKEQMSFQQDVYQAQERVMKGLMAEIRAAVRAVANKHHYQMVLNKDAAMYASNRLDISHEVLDVLH